MVRQGSYIIAVIVMVALTACGTRARDEALIQLYRDGIDYIVTTQAELEKTQNAAAAAEVIANSLPRLRELVTRKKALEQKYPELQNTQKREEIHAQFADFHTLRQKARELYLYGSKLALKYQSHPRFMQASREGWELLAYF